MSGGKRLRPAFAVWGWVAAAGLPSSSPGPLLTAAASLDLLHVSALVHDDVMDSSDLRRGQPAAHREFERLHATAGWLGDSAVFGHAGAILLGDLLLMWSVQMLHEAGLDPVALGRALPVLEAMRTEVTCGQFLDVVAQAQPTNGHGRQRALDEANRVVEYKSARYTVQRPCQFGAALGGGDERLQQTLADYGSPLGRAFQFRDDLLGVFGDPALTGKPAGDDLREGKRTLLVAHTYAQTTPAGLALLDALFGDPGLDADGVARLQQVIADSGAKQAVERMISSNHDRALAALAAGELTDPGRTALTALAEAAVQRDY
nr:polyprenyl synthetase family protein [Microlunatus panaciterrae]